MRCRSLVPLVALTLLLLAACRQEIATILPTRVPLLSPAKGQNPLAAVVPPTWTPPPAVDEPAEPGALRTLRPTATPSQTPILPTSTPVTPSPTATRAAAGTPTPQTGARPKPRTFETFAPDEPLPLELYPRPLGDNGWGMHWIPTVRQERAVIDRFVAELARMHIKWVVFLNEGTNIGGNDYLVERLVAHDMMPVMRVYQSSVQPYDGDLGAMVAHYRAKGVIYFQLYNEPNVNEENDQGVPNPTIYAVNWAAAARDVINNGGLPGIGALSPGGAYDHNHFLDRTLRTLIYNGDAGLLNRAWLSIHNYHGLRARDDPGGFLLFRTYDEIVRDHLGRSLPMIGTEAGSYSPDPQVEKELLAFQYSYMRGAEPYFFAFSWWLLANAAAGAWDDTWEWQTLIRPDWVHPAVTEFFYVNSR